MKKQLNFPPNFLWGAATASYQIEGNIKNCDWSHEVLEKNKSKIKWAEDVIDKIPQAGKACDSWDRLDEDLEAIKKLGSNIYRLSIEWSRVEPEPGQFDMEAISRYKNFLKKLQKNNIKVMLTLHHFTNPIWTRTNRFNAWESSRMIKYYLRYTKKIVTELGDYVNFWITINEPITYTFMSYQMGFWPPMKKNIFLAGRVLFNMARAHKKAYRLIHNLSPHKTSVGIANDLQAYSNYAKHKLIEQLRVYFLYNFSNHSFYKLTGIKHHDFLGINYYFEVRSEKKRGQNQFTTYNAREEERLLTDMEWLIYPRGIFDVMQDLSHYQKPIIVTENGVATTDDSLRIRFIKEHLEEIYYCIKSGVNIIGYCHWSLLDNFEWAEGYRPKFGLFRINPDTYAREIKPSAEYYRDIIKDNGIKWEY